MYLMIMLWNW